MAPVLTEIAGGFAMYCRFCGRKIPEDALFCSYCGKDVVSDDADSPPRSGEPFEQGAESDEFQVYDDFELNKEDFLPSLFEGIEDEELRDEPDQATASPSARVRGGSLVFGIILSVLLFILTVITALSGIFRYITTDKTVRAAVEKTNFDDLTVSTVEGKETFSDFLCRVISDAGGDLDISARDVRKLTKEASFKEFFGEVFTDCKNDLLRGKTVEPIELGTLADWMYDNSEIVIAIFGMKAFDSDARDVLKAGLSEYSLDLRAEDFESATGLDRGVCLFVSSDVFFFAILVFSIGAVALIFVAGGFDAKFFFSSVGLSFVFSGLALLLIFGAVAISADNSGLLVSVILSSSLTPFIIICAAAVLMGFLFIVISALIGRARKKSRA